MTTDRIKELLEKSICPACKVKLKRWLTNEPDAPYTSMSVVCSGCGNSYTMEYTTVLSKVYFPSNFTPAVEDGDDPLEEA